MYRKSYIEINEDNILFNINKIQSTSRKKLIAVVKANGYSTDDIRISKLAIKNGVDFIAVSSLEEALHLRTNGIECELLILGYVDGRHLSLVKENDLSIVTVSYDYVKDNIENLKDVKVHIKLNTGMNRIGILPSQAKEVFDLLISNNAKVEGIMTHYACADCDEEFTLKQYELFKNTVESFDYKFKYIHSQASDASFLLRDKVSNYCRSGLAMLGYSEFNNGLKPALSLYSEVTNVKKVPKGEGISYGQHYTSDGEGYILTIPIGYADGYLRHNTGKDVFVENEIGTIVGSVCMDQCMIHTNNYHPVGTKVELFGSHISIQERANEVNTITYELITNLSDRLPKSFVSDNKVMEEINIRFQ